VGELGFVFSAESALAFAVKMKEISKIFGKIPNC
jgi:hypothetical protein